MNTWAKEAPDKPHREEKLMFELNDHGSQVLLFPGKNFILSEEPEQSGFRGAPLTLIGRVQLTEQDTDSKWLLKKAWFKHEIEWDKVSGSPIPGTDLVRITAFSSNDLKCSIGHAAIDKQSGPVSVLHTSRWVSDKDDVPNWYRHLRAKYPTSEIPLVKLDATTVTA